MASDRGSDVRIRYPHQLSPDDETWLLATASRHNGTLRADAVFSHPIKRVAAFPSNADAIKFIDELTESGRWAAELVS